MRNKFVSLQALALLVIFCLTGSLTRAAVNPKPFVVPELKQWTGKDGNFTPGKDTRIVCTSQNPELLRIARMEHTHTPATGGTKSGTLTPARNDS